MNIREWFEREETALTGRLARGEITVAQYRRDIVDLITGEDVIDEETRRYLIATNRGHLLRDQ